MSGLGARRRRARTTVVLATVILVGLLSSLASRSVAAAVSGWAPAALPKAFYVGNGTDGPANAPVSCVVGTTNCMAVVLHTPSTTTDSVGFGVVHSSNLVIWTGYASLPRQLTTVVAISCATTASCIVIGTARAGTPVIALSSDGGRTWAPLTPPGQRTTSWTPTDVACPAASTCYVTGSTSGGSGPVLAVTRDGGHTWASLDSRLPGPANYGLNAISCSTPVDCVAVGGRATAAIVVATANGGTTWTRSTAAVLADLATLVTVSCAVPATCYAGGSLRAGEPAILSTTDGGAHWRGDVLSIGTGRISAMSCASSSTCWSTATGGTVALVGSADAGKVWGDYSGGGAQSSGSVSCATTEVCVATTDDGLWVTESDGGVQPNGTSLGPPSTGTVPPGSVPPVVASPTTAGVSVDPAEAARVARGLWTERDLALHNRDPVALAVVESDPALAVDAPQCHAGCPPPPLFVLSGVSLDVPRQTSWPAYFLADVTYTSNCFASKSPCDDMFVAVQPSPGARWTMTMYDPFSGPSIASINGPGGFAVAPPTGTNASQLLTDYAAVLQSIKVSGKPPAGSIFLAGLLTTGLEKTNYLPEVKANAQGYSYSMTYTRGSTPTYQFDTTEGTLTCGTVDWTEVDTALPHLSLAQLTDRNEWDWTLAAGSYQRIVSHGLHMDCFLPDYSTTTTGSTPREFVFGDWVGPVSTLGYG